MRASSLWCSFWLADQEKELAPGNWGIFLSLMFKWDGFLWNEYNLASVCWQFWHHFPSSWSVRLWIQIKQNCRNWQKLWHVTLWQWWDDHCEIIAFLATFGSEFISWITIKIFHDFIHPLPVIIDDSCWGEHNMITPAVSCPSWLRLTAACLFVVSFQPMDFWLRVTTDTGYSNRHQLTLVCVHTLARYSSDLSTPTLHPSRLPNLHLSSYILWSFLK